MAKQAPAVTAPPKKNAVRTIALAACVYYTAATFLLLFIYWIINLDLSRGMNPLSLILILPFSIFFAVANYIYGIEKLDTWVRVILHYVITMTGIWCFLFLPNQRGGTASGALILFVVLTVIYAMIMSVILIVKGRIRRITRDETEYVSVYGKK
ncbi:MAG: hypothetical protein E7663_00875 [Ruminococcaceae bacterium]|nr:hypothetical protein [Oscillospiraceae bacterium]